MIEQIKELSITEDIITPWSVQIANSDGIDYNKLLEKIGMSRINADLVKKFENVTGKAAHYFFRREILIAHRDFDKCLDLYAEKKPFYLYTGICPAESLHLGHFIQFYISKWLQDVFDIPVIIQITDDEKILWNDLKPDVLPKLVKETVKNLIAFNFNPAKTFIFSNFNYMGQTPEYYRNVIRVRKSVTYGQIKNTFGFTDSDPIGKIVFPSLQLVPALSTSFPEIFGNEKVQPIIVSGLDQEPYIRLMHEISQKLDFPTPISIHSIFFPALHGVRTKMSTSDVNTAIFLSDTAKQIKTKINKHAFSGGRVTVEEHREFGGDTNVDVSYHLLKFFQSNDDELEKIRSTYSSGELLSGEIKKHAFECIQEIVATHQETKKTITDDIIDQFVKPKNMK
ncbi:hypothetical protein PVAND_002043 [Polypedilum vanderplanki]|uniref:Tryptophan--tRNA ligase, cytoplasmic n=1 Tax=Polypedilum vanderplanki TaxID=319348 RepID=A0A9J6BPS1_POLVA|nr:hypothetical protein PVAND_002043 [Polypedilum vanderplanki]